MESNSEIKLRRSRGVRFRSIWIDLGLLGALLLFAVFADKILGPWFDDRSEQNEVATFLTGCKPDEMRVMKSMQVRPDDGWSYYTAIVNFTRKECECGSTSKRPVLGFKFGRFWTSPIRVGLNEPGPSVYSDSQIAEIKAALAALPVPQQSNEDSRHHPNQFHIAFWVGNEMRIYNYPVGQAHSECNKLMQILIPRQ